MILLAISILASLLITYFLLPRLMKFLYATGVVSLDIHKTNKPRLPASGGICVACGVLSGILIYTGLQTFIHGNYTSSIYLLTAVSSILIVTFTGMLDDLNVKSRPVITKDGKNIKIGFPQWLKPLLILPAAIPLMVMNVGDTTMAVPFVGDVNFGILYPLLIVPIGMLGASNMVNMLGGFNGVEAGMGLVYTLGLGVYSLINGNEIAAIIFLSTFASLLPFLKYNRYPAKILPGDSLTYLLGAIVAVGVIIGNMEKIGLIVMIPFIVQGILKFYSKIRLGEFASDLGVLQKDGTIKSKYKGTYSLTHLVMKLGNFREYQISIILILVQVIFTILPFLKIF
jgi:UDP-N-acetylglucosamine--dolichyl-phosphate N-acetylglucosaminephosphotransferase